MNNEAPSSAGKFNNTGDALFCFILFLSLDFGLFFVSNSRGVNGAQ